MPKAIKKEKPKKATVNFPLTMDIPLHEKLTQKCDAMYPFQSLHGHIIKLIQKDLGLVK